MIEHCTARKKKMATLSSIKEQIKNREPDWRGKLEKRFRWSKFRREWGRWCFIVTPVEGYGDFVWWEWESDGDK